MQQKHPLDVATHLEEIGNGSFVGLPSPGYQNMVGPYGGITCAVMLKAVIDQSTRLGEPIALTVNFLAPIREHKFVVSAEMLHTGRTTQHWFVRLMQGVECMASATVVCATRRSSWADTEATFPEPAHAPETLQPFENDAAPDWTRQYDMRFLPGFEIGAMDGVPRGSGVSKLWVRDRQPRVLDFVSLAAITDCFIPRVYLRRQKHSPAGTVSLTTYFHCDAATLRAVGEEHLLGVAHPMKFQGGYFEQRAELWSASGSLVASTFQMVYFKD